MMDKRFLGMKQERRLYQNDGSGWSHKCVQQSSFQREPAANTMKVIMSDDERISIMLLSWYRLLSMGQMITQSMKGEYQKKENRRVNYVCSY